MKQVKFIFILTSVLLSSCGVNSNLMFKEAKNAPISKDIPLTPREDYKISVDDKLSFTLSTRNGAQIIERISGVSSEAGRQNGQIIEYVVRKDSTARFPVVGKLKVVGLSIEECETLLEKLYSSEYKDPFVQVRITNQRVIVFPGNGSDARVIPLLNENTTIMEAIAQAGGITDRGKANTIKLIRSEGEGRVIYKLDLSTIEGLKYVDMIVQGNDYIYIEPTKEIAKEIAQDVVPVVSLLSSALFIISAVNLLK